MSVYNNKIQMADGTVLIDLTADTATADKVLSGYNLHLASGEGASGSCTFDSDTSADTATAAQLLSGVTAHARGAQLTGTMPDRGAQSGTIATKSGAYTIPEGYHNGSGSVAISAAEQAKLVSGNIVSGVTILGVTGSAAVPSGTLTLTANTAGTDCTGYATVVVAIPTYDGTVS